MKRFEIIIIALLVFSILGCTGLMSASKNGKINAVTKYLDGNADVNITNKQGYTPLMFAAAAGHFEVVKKLIDSGADVNKRNHRGNTALIEASSYKGGNVRVSKYLIDNGADLNINGDAGTALIRATRWSHAKIVKLLIDNGADINAIGPYSSALSSAAVGGNRQDFEIAKILIDNGADVNGRGSDRSIKEMFERSNKRRVKRGDKPLDITKESIDRYADRTQFRHSPLRAAARSGEKKMMSLLLRNGARLPKGKSLLVTSAGQIKVHSIGGEKGRQMIILSPGTYRFYITYDGYWKGKPINLVLNAEDGEIYYIMHKIGNHRWSAWIDRI